MKISMERQNNGKNNLLMILRGSDFSVKNMLNSTISMSYPDVVIACIEHKVSLEAFRAIEAALVKHDNNMKDYSLVVDYRSP